MSPVQSQRQRIERQGKGKKTVQKRNNLNKTEGQSNNKMSISPLAVPDVNFLFLQTCSAVRMRGGVVAAFK